MARVVVMGVAGAGKTTVGRATADRLGVPFVDADDLHTPEDRAWMAAGHPLDEARRGPWIDRVHDALARVPDVVVACSALRRVHRDRLRAAGDVSMYLLDVPEAVLDDRLRHRRAHFFPEDLLGSQLAAFDPPEPDEPIVVLDGTLPVATLADRIATRVRV